MPIVACAAVLVAAAIVTASRGEWAATALVAVAAAAGLLGLTRPEALLALWIAASPWASYALRYPAERSIVTFDRVVVVAVALGLLAQAARLRTPGPAEIAWAAYGTVGLASALLLSRETGYAARIALDALALPLLLFYAVRNGANLARGAPYLFWGAVALALALPWPGVFELATGIDVMPVTGGALVRSGVVRPNGPFANDVIYAVVGAVLAVALARAPGALGLELRGASRALWRVSVAAALVVALLPMFRTVALALAVALAIPWVLAGRVRTLARAALAGALVAVAALPIVARVAETHTFQDRVTDPSSLFSRVATLNAGAGVVADHPLTGVGLANYGSYFDAKYGTAWYVSVDEVAGVGAERSPHNNLLGVWAELGLAGVFFYVLAAATAAGAAWRRRNTFALALLAVYAVPGATLYHGIYSESNLALFCALGVALRAAEDAP